MTRLITSIRVDPFDSPPRDLVVVFASSGVIGTLAIDTGKGHALAAEMLGVTVEAFRAVARVHDGRSFQVFASELPAVDSSRIAECSNCKRFAEMHPQIGDVCRRCAS